MAKPTERPRLSRTQLDGRYKVLPEYSRDGTIVGWTVTRNDLDLGFWYEQSRALAVAHRIARGVSELETCPYPDPIRCCCPTPGKGHRV